MHFCESLIVSEPQLRYLGSRLFIQSYKKPIREEWTVCMVGDEGLEPPTLSV